MANFLSLQDKNKDLFLARTSHELRTPLQSIKMGLETINDGAAKNDKENQKKIMPLIMQQTARMENNVIAFKAKDWDQPVRISIPEKEFLKYKKFLMNDGENLLAKQKNKFKQIEKMGKYCYFCS